jgi:hypothetical protein
MSNVPMRWLVLVALILVVIAVWMGSFAITALVFLAFVGLFVGMQFWAAYAMGWSSMARAYRFSGRFSGNVPMHWLVLVALILVVIAVWVESFAITALVLLAFLSLYVGTQFWAARAIGWSFLARAYRFSGRFSGQTWWLKYCRLVRMRWAGCEGSLNAFFPNLPRDLPNKGSGTAYLGLDIGGNAEGLYVAAPRWLQFWRPVLFFPWCDVAVSAEQIQGEWVNCLEFRFRKVPGVLLQLTEQEYGPLIAAAGESWPGLVQSRTILTSSAE